MNSYQQWQIVVKFNIALFYRYFYNHLSNYTKTIIRLRLVNIGEYSPRLRLGEYSPIFTSPSANNMYLLTEWEGRTGKYLARGHGVRTSLRSVRAPCSRAKYFPVRPDLTQSISILLYDHHAFPFFFFFFFFG